VLLNSRMSDKSAKLSVNNSKISDCHRPTADIHIVDLAEPSFETDLEKESRDFFLKTQ